QTPSFRASAVWRQRWTGSRGRRTPRGRSREFSRRLLGIGNPETDMRMPCRPSRVATVVLALALLWSPRLVPAQQATPNQVLIAAVAGNPADAPRLTAQEVVAGAPDRAPSIGSAVVGA